MKINNICQWVVTSLALFALTINLGTPNQGSGFMVKADTAEGESKAAEKLVGGVQESVENVEEAVGEEDEEPQGEVQILTGENFERLTQVATGATTGDWFIKFYAPWCGHCRKMEPTWNELAQKLGGQVNVGKVDVTANKSLGKRFGIKSFPTLLMFSHGKVYKFSAGRKLDTLMTYAKGGFKSDEPRMVPKPSNFVDSLKDFFKTFKNDMAGIPKGKRPQPYSIAFLVAALMVLVTLIFLVMPSGSPGSSTTPSRLKTD